MRKFLIVAILGAIALLVSCDKFGACSPGDNYDTSDSAQVAEFINSVTNPQLMSVEEALSLKSNMLEKQSIDSAFLALDNDLISTVTTVLLKKKTSVTKKDILQEYRRCSDVYNNLPKQNAQKGVDKTGTDLGTRQDTGSTSVDNGGNTNRVLSNSYSYRTDTVNGQPIRVRIQKIETYE